MEKKHTELNDGTALSVASSMFLAVRLTIGIKGFNFLGNVGVLETR